MAHIVVAIPAVEDSDLPETLKHLYALSSRQHELTVVVHEQCSTHGQRAEVFAIQLTKTEQLRITCGR